MTSPSKPTSIREVEKVDVAHVEDAQSIDEKEVLPAGKVDYSGFSQKTDPKEIKLVRKLDLHIMVSAVIEIREIGGLTPDLPVGNVLAQLSRSKRHCACEEYVN
jgi:hypothetical protein